MDLLAEALTRHAANAVLGALALALALPVLCSRTGAALKLFLIALVCVVVAAVALLPFPVSAAVACTASGIGAALLLLRRCGLALNHFDSTWPLLPLPASPLFFSCVCSLQRVARPFHSPVPKRSVEEMEERMRTATQTETHTLRQEVQANYKDYVLKMANHGSLRRCVPVCV